MSAGAIGNSYGIPAPPPVTGNLAAKYPERVRSLVVTGSMPVFYGPLAPLPETDKVRKAALRERGVTAGTWDRARTAGRAAQA